MLETIAKGRLEVRRPAAPHAKAAKAAQDPDDSLEDLLQRQEHDQVCEQLTLQAQRERYDFQTAERTEMEREYNNTRDLILAQMKADDEVVKKYIAMI